MEMGSSKAQLLICSFQTSGFCQPYRQLTHLTELVKNIGTLKEQSMCECAGSVYDSEAVLPLDR